MMAFLLYFSLTILHTNDVHARVLEFTASGSNCSAKDSKEGKCFGGVARRATKINEIRAKKKNVLLLDGGDQFQGSLFYTQYKGKEAAVFMNLLGYDAMAVGNHEFDDGPPVLASFIKQTNFPVLSANIDASREPALKNLINPTTIVTVEGEKIGIVGMTTIETATASSPGKNISFLPIISSVQKAVDALTKQGINKIIAVSHAGFGTDRETARAVKGLDLIISGHTDTFLSNVDPTAQGPYPVVEKSPEGKPVLLVSDYTWGKYLGKIDVAFNEEGVPVQWQGEPILLDNGVKPDAAVLAKAEEMYKPIAALHRKIIGETKTALIGDRQMNRFQESNLGNLITEAMLWKTKERGGQVAITNGGGIRSGIPVGKISYGTVLEVLPFSNTIHSFDLTGKDLRKALEHGVAKAESVQNDGTGRFPQVAGLRYAIDLSKKSGKRILKVEIKNKEGAFEPLALGRTYRVVTNDFIAGGGDGYEIFKQRGKNKYDHGILLSEVVANYITKHSPVRTAVDGRIKIQ
ncbi:MAG: bifunctional metallophosphatase/5'-nucleotidase [Deltaproteobacteria bacterium]|nr:bifunctional metallophosphatase/5'-nucleotidase [Deltaproteobacteria bacterium]